MFAIKNHTVMNNLIWYHCFKFICKAYVVTVTVFDAQFWSLTNTELCNRSHSQGAEQLHHPRSLLSSPLLSAPPLAATDLSSAPVALALPRLPCPACSLQEGVFRLSSGVWGSAVSLHASRSPVIARWCSVVGTHQSSVSFRLKHIWVVSSLGQLWIKLL